MNPAYMKPEHEELFELIGAEGIKILRKKIFFGKDTNSTLHRIAQRYKKDKSKTIVFVHQRLVKLLSNEGDFRAYLMPSAEELKTEVRGSDLRGPKCTFKLRNFMYRLDLYNNKLELYDNKWLLLKAKGVIVSTFPTIIYYPGKKEYKKVHSNTHEFKDISITDTEEIIKRIKEDYTGYGRYASETPYICSFHIALNEDDKYDLYETPRVELVKSSW